MAGFFDFLFGGEDTSGQDLTIQQRQQALPLVQGATEQGRQDLLSLIPEQIAAQQGGAQAALNLFGQSIPQQFSTFQQGNVGAQNALLAGLPQQQAALLGLPINNAALQPQSIGFSTDFAQQQLPAFDPSILQGLSVPPQQIPTTVPTQDPGLSTNADLIADLIAGIGSGLPAVTTDPENTALNINQGQQDDLVSQIFEGDITQDQILSALSGRGSLPGGLVIDPVTGQLVNPNMTQALDPETQRTLQQLLASQLGVGVGGIA